MIQGVEEKISSIAIESILHEVGATPKPGLVDRNNCGAHDDMDIFTFFSSVSVLQPYFSEMAIIGSRFNDDDFTKLLKAIRPVGKEAEESMFKVTGGINTHKGLIFSLGILCTATAFLHSSRKRWTAETICEISSLMCRDIVNRELKKNHREITIGEKLYKKDGIRGIRGEAEDGFPSVINKSLPYLRGAEEDWNNRLINTLLHLMSIVEDSNIIGRHSLKRLAKVQNQAQEVLDSGGASDERGLEILRQIDLNFIENNISPGGSADLLAVTIFLYKIELASF